MPPTGNDTNASDANSPDMAPPATPPFAAPLDTLPATAVIGDAGGATVTALSDDLKYTLTVGQALEIFTALGRKAPSARSVQRYCIEGRLAAQKIRTTYGSEWLINEDSLRQLIENEPVISVVAGDANSPDMVTPATPPMQKTQFVAPVSSDTTATGVAVAAERQELATPDGERRTIAAVLIENSRLVAQVEGKDAIIAELKEDRSFLREEVREARKTRDDVKNIAERMLDTLKTMAIGRLAASNPTAERMSTIIDHVAPQE